MQRRDGQNHFGAGLIFPAPKMVKTEGVFLRS